VVELAGAVIVGLLTVLGIRLLLARGIFFGSRQRQPERDAKRRPVHPHWTRTEQPPKGQQPPEHEREREAERWRQRQWVSKQSKESEWWRVLEVSPYASANEIRRSYLRKIKQTHPDRVVWLAPELLPLAEGRAKALNAAYAEAGAGRGRRNSANAPRSRAHS
jgi:DnaJ-like protein